VIADSSKVYWNCNWCRARPSDVETCSGIQVAWNYTQHFSDKTVFFPPKNQSIWRCGTTIFLARLLVYPWIYTFPQLKFLSLFIYILSYLKPSFQLILQYSLIYFFKSYEIEIGIRFKNLHIGQLSGWKAYRTKLSIDGYIFYKKYHML
jgi:hypothetical protein